MKNVFTLFLAGTMLFLLSCSDDDGEPEIDDLVGEWELDDLVASDLPSGYEFAINPESGSTVWGEDSYVIEFFEDGTYERELSDTFAGDVEDEGTWVRDGEDIDLDQEEADSDEVATSFTIDGEITDRGMTLIGEDLWYAWPPIIVDNPEALDTIETQEDLNLLFQEYGEVVEVTVTMEFDRQ